MLKNLKWWIALFLTLVEISSIIAVTLIDIEDKTTINISSFSVYFSAMTSLIHHRTNRPEDK